MELIHVISKMGKLLRLNLVCSYRIFSMSSFIGELRHPSIFLPDFIFECCLCVTVHKSWGKDLDNWGFIYISFLAIKLQVRWDITKQTQKADQMLTFLCITMLALGALGSLNVFVSKDLKDIFQLYISIVVRQTSCSHIP